MAEKLFKEEDLEIAIAFLEQKGCLPANSRKKVDVDAYLDNGGNSIVVVSSKKRPGVLKDILSQNVLSVYEIRANEDYEVLTTLKNAYRPVVVPRDVYYPDFKEEYLAKKEAETPKPEM